MATWNSRGLRGSTLEEFINRTNETYLTNGLALIQKVPTPITPINIDKATRHITLAYFDKNYPEIGKQIEEKKVLDEELGNKILEVAEEFKNKSR